MPFHRLYVSSQFHGGCADSATNWPGSETMSGLRTAPIQIIKRLPGVLPSKALTAGVARGDPRGLSRFSCIGSFTTLFCTCKTHLFAQVVVMYKLALHSHWKPMRHRVRQSKRYSANPRENNTTCLATSCFSVYAWQGWKSTAIEFFCFWCILLVLLSLASTSCVAETGMNGRTIGDARRPRQFQFRSYQQDRSTGSARAAIAGTGKPHPRESDRSKDQPAFVPRPSSTSTAWLMSLAWESWWTKYRCESTWSFSGTPGCCRGMVSGSLYLF